MSAITAVPQVDARAVKARLLDLLRRAERAARVNDFIQAREVFEAAFVLGTAAGANDHAAESLAGLGYVAHLRGEMLDAEALYARALAGPLAPSSRAVITARLGFAHYDRGELEQARAVLNLAAADAKAAADRGRALGFLGNVARAAGDTRQALELYADAVEILATAGDARFAHTFSMDRAIVDLLDGNARSALVRLEGLVHEPLVAAEPHLALLVSHYAVLARHRLGLPVVEPSIGDHPIAPFLARARALVAEGRHRREALSELSGSAPLNAHARLTLHILGDLDRRTAAVEARALVVERTGAFFRLGDEPLVSLVQRPALARMLHALATWRIARPGILLEGDRLVELTWPGERILPAARKNRLHVAIATLRKLGLRSVLESVAGSYRLCRDVGVVLVD